MGDLKRKSLKTITNKFTDLEFEYAQSPNPTSHKYARQTNSSKREIAGRRNSSNERSLKDLLSNDIRLVED